MSGGLPLHRREFLQASAVGAAALGLGLLRLRPAPAQPAIRSGAPPPYGDWRDVYRERWAWDRIVRSTHFVN